MCGEALRWQRLTVVRAFMILLAWCDGAVKRGVVLGDTRNMGAMAGQRQNLRL